MTRYACTTTWFMPATRKLCKKCGTQIPYDRSKHQGSSVCHIGRELRKIAASGLIAVSMPAPTSEGHTTRAGTLAVCEILKLDYTLVLSVRTQPWVCVTPEVEATLRAVNAVAHGCMLVVPEAARRLVDKRDVLLEFDALRRLGADDDALFSTLALAGIAGEKAQFEERCRQRNPRRSDRSIEIAWMKFWHRRRARKLKSKSWAAEGRL